MVYIYSMFIYEFKWVYNFETKPVLWWVLSPQRITISVKKDKEKRKRIVTIFIISEN